MNDLFENIYKGKTVLVTGETGFKGSWLATWLLNLGANVVGYALSKAINRLKWYPVFDFNQTLKFAIDEYSIDNYTPDEIYLISVSTI